MTNRGVNKWIGNRKETYEATNSEYRKNSESHEYFVIPTRYPKQTRINGDNPDKKFISRFI